jgi:hypothetical protein
MALKSFIWLKRLEMNPTNTILLIEPDETAARELADLLRTRPGQPRVVVATDVPAVASLFKNETIDWLFIRISAWDSYQSLAGQLDRLPRHVVFLSGRNEKNTGHLATVVDAHLQPPYRAGRVAKVWDRLSDIRFVPRPLDIFFVRSGGRWTPVRYCDLRQVRRENRQLQVDTLHAEYRITESLLAFQSRLPVALTPSNCGGLINEAFYAGRWNQKVRQMFLFR